MTKKSFTEELNSLIVEENLQMRIGAALTNMVVFLPSDATLVSVPKNKILLNGDKVIYVNMPDTYVEWRYSDMEKKRPSKGCLSAFVQHRDASDEQIRDFVRDWGPLALSGWNLDGKWYQDDLEDWRGISRSACAIFRLSQKLQGSQPYGKNEEELAELWRQVPWWPKVMRSAFPRNSGRMDTPEGVYIGDLGSDLNPIAVSRTTIAYQRSLLAAFVSDWLMFARATPRVCWVEEHPTLTFVRVEQKKLAPSDSYGLSKKKQPSKKMPFTTSFQVPAIELSQTGTSGYSALTTARNSEAEIVKLSTPTVTVLASLAVPSDTFLAIAIQLAAVVLSNYRGFECQYCGKIKIADKASGRGQPRRYCDDKCLANAKVVQRRNKRDEQRRVIITTPTSE